MQEAEKVEVTPSSIQAGSPSIDLSNEDVWVPKLDRKQIKRGKVPRFDGRSLRDWNQVVVSRKAKMGKLDTDELDIRKLPAMSREEVAEHNEPDSLWMVIHGVVYDLTLFQRYHPGGEESLRECSGRDGSWLFDKFHKWVACEALLMPFAVGQCR